MDDDSTHTSTSLFDAIHATLAPAEDDQHPITGHVFQAGKRAGHLDGIIKPATPLGQLTGHRPITANVFQAGERTGYIDGWVNLPQLPMRHTPSRPGPKPKTRQRMAMLLAFRLFRSQGKNVSEAYMAVASMFQRSGKDVGRYIRNQLAQADIAKYHDAVFLRHGSGPGSHVLFRAAWWNRDGLHFEGILVGAWCWREGAPEADYGKVTWEFDAKDGAQADVIAQIIERDLNGNGPANNPPAARRGRPPKK